MQLASVALLSGVGSFLRAHVSSLWCSAYLRRSISLPLCCLRVILSSQFGLTVIRAVWSVCISGCIRGRCSLWVSTIVFRLDI